MYVGAINSWSFEDKSENSEVAVGGTVVMNLCFNMQEIIL